MLAAPTAAHPLWLTADLNNDKINDTVARFYDTQRGTVVDVTWSGKNLPKVETVLGDGSAVFQTPVVLRDVSGDGQPDLTFSFKDSAGVVHTRTALGLASGNFATTVEALSFADLGSGRTAALLRGNVLEIFDGNQWSVNNTRTMSLASLGNGVAAELLTNGELQILTATSSHTDNSRTFALVSLGGNRAEALLTDGTLQTYDGATWTKLSDFVIEADFFTALRFSLFDTTKYQSIASLANADLIENKIWQAILAYERLFTNALRVKIRFQDMTTGLGQSHSQKTPRPTRIT